MQKSNNLGARLVKLLGTAFAVWAASELVYGINVHNFWTSILVGLVLGFLNSLVKPLLTVISIPLIVLSFGLFLIVINAVLLMFSSELISSFHVSGFWPAVWGSIIISAVSFFLEPRKPREPQEAGTSKWGNQ